MRVEVQLRTIAMDFWASLDHKLSYNKEIPDGEANILKRELLECAQASSELDRRMEDIKKKYSSFLVKRKVNLFKNRRTFNI